MLNNHDPVLIRHLAPRNFLSFGPENTGIELKSLNLLIGPNGSGKSNLFEAVRFLRSAPKELRDVTREGGGVAEWIWKGQPSEPAWVEWCVNCPKNPIALRHSISFREISQSFALDDERVEERTPRSAREEDAYFYYRYQHGIPVINPYGKAKRNLARDTVEPDRSILAQSSTPTLWFRPKLRVRIRRIPRKAPAILCPAKHRSRALRWRFRSSCSMPLRLNRRKSG